MTTRPSCVLIGIFAISCIASSDPAEEPVDDPAVELAALPSVSPIVGVTASGAETGNGPANAIDGSLATRWSNNGVGSWIQADLGSGLSVSSVSIAWYVGNQRTSRFTVSTSQDGSLFRQVHAGSSSGTTASLERYAFAVTSARYVRVTVNGNSQSSWASITELRVEAAAAEVPPTPTPSTQD